MKRKNVKGLALTPAAPKPPPTAETRVHEEDSQQLEIGIEYKLDLKPEDLDILKELGSGNGGTVSKVKHLTTGTVMARKVSNHSRVPVHLHRALRLGQELF
jgi:mitogen-activated protein kinase kinase